MLFKGGELEATKAISPNSVLPRVVVKPQVTVNYADPTRIAARNEIISELWHAKTSAARADEPMDTDPAPPSVGNIFQTGKKKARSRKLRDQIMRIDRSAVAPTSPAVSESFTFVDATEPITSTTSDMSDSPAGSEILAHARTHAPDRHHNAFSWSKTGRSPLPLSHL